MKILMVSSFLPFPLTSGGHIRLYNLIKKLSKNHKLSLICEKREYQNQTDILQLKKFCKEVFCIDRKKQWTFFNIIRTGFSWYPFLLVGHTSSVMKKKIQMLLDNKFDVIHVETSYVIQNLPKTPLPIVLVEHNIEYLVYQRFVKNAPFFLRPLLYLDVMKLRYWEKKFWGKATRLIAVSENEQKIMNQKATIVPNGVDLASFPFYENSSVKEKRILFIGDFKWLKNKDAAEWLVKKVWPRIKKPGLKLWIIGREIPNAFKELSKDENIIFDEHASEKTTDIFRESFILLAPIRIGGGTSFKILEAMASGIPVVTTKLGIEGISATDGNNVLLAETQEEFVKSVEELLNDRTVYRRLAKNARELIEKKYSWDDIVKKLEEVYTSCL